MPFIYLCSVKGGGRVWTGFISNVQPEKQQRLTVDEFHGAQQVKERRKVCGHGEGAHCSSLCSPHAGPVVPGGALKHLLQRLPAQGCSAGPLVPFTPALGLCSPI